MHLACSVGITLLDLHARRTLDSRQARLNLTGASLLCISLPGGDLAVDGFIVGLLQEQAVVNGGGCNHACSMKGA